MPCLPRYPRPAWCGSTTTSTRSRPGQSVGPFPPEFQKLSSGFIPDLFGPDKPNFTALILVAVAAAAIVWTGIRGRAREAEFGITPEPAGFFWARNAVVVVALLFVGWKLASFRGLPNVLLVMSVLIVLYAFFTEQTVIGRRIYALGGNEKAAALTGIPVVRVKIEVYVICALAAGLQGIIICGWLGSAPANMATSYELNVIAAAVIGGANLAGGAGGPLGAIVGCVLLEVIRNGLVLAQVNSYWQQTLVGVIIIAAVLVDRLRSRMA